MLNLKNITNEPLTRENILKRVSEYDIYKYYLQDVPLNTTSNSPFRRDNVPSFGLYYSRNNELMFNDFRLGSGNVFKFVMWMEQVKYYEALSIINKIFQLKLFDSNPVDYKVTRKPEITNYKPTVKEATIIRIKLRDFNLKDVDYFYPLDVTKIHRLYPVEYFWLNTYCFKAHELAYGYRYDRNIYKIYQPLEKDNKWYTNISSKVNWYGHDILPKTGDILFVASSNKDAAVLHQIGFNAIAPHTEAQMFSQEQYKEYSSRFKRIIIFYDNDETGIIKATKFSETYDLDFLALEEEDTKDPFEFIKKYDLETLKDWTSQYL